MRKKIIRSLIILMLVAGAVTISVPEVKKAEASGTLYLAKSSTANRTESLKYPSATVDFWGVVTGAENAEDGANEAHVGWTCSASQENKYTNYRAVLGWDISDLPEGVELVTAIVKTWTRGIQTYDALNPYFGLYKTAVPTLSIVYADYNSAYTDYSKRVMFEYHQYSEFNPTDYEWFEWEVLPERLDEFVTPDENGCVWLTLASMYDMTTNAPPYSAGDSVNVGGTIGSYPELWIYYIEDTPPRDVEILENAAVDDTVDGTETADNITWQSPRAGYADEWLHVRVDGESGAVLDLELRDSAGEVLHEISDSIRVDDNFDWYINLPDTYYGWVRAVEANNNLVGEWGYVMPSPDADQAGNTLYAVNTQHPQYDMQFSRYVKYENELMVVHWKSNIQSDELGEHELRLYNNGDNATLYFSENFTWLNDNYYYSSVNNTGLAGWRYAIFTPNVEGEGINDYDGMVIDMDANYSSWTSGFIEGRIMDTTDNSTLAGSHSCYWYLQNEADGIIMRINKNVYNITESIDVKIQIGVPSKVNLNLPSVTARIIDAEESEISVQYETAEIGLTTFSMVAPADAGVYELRLVFAGDGAWEYIHDIPFTVRAGEEMAGVEDILVNINEWIAERGMDNPAGYWIIVIIAMALSFMLTIQSPVLRVLLPVLIFGFAIVAGWLETWVIVLLALVAGGSVFALMRKKMHGDSGAG